MTTQIFESYCDFLKREDKAVNGVSPEFAKNRPDYEKQNETNQACWDCEACDNCWDCDNCKDCKRCWDCKDCWGLQGLRGLRGLQGLQGLRGLLGILRRVK